MRRIIIALSAFAAAALVLAITAKGMNLSNDSRDYMAAARDIQQIGGIPITYSWWPPLYPMTLAPFTDMQQAARLMNALCFSGTVGLTLWALKSRVNDWALAGVGAALLLSPSFHFVHSYVWSEALFVLLVAAWFALLLNEVTTWRHLVLIALVAAILGLQRYVGILFVPLGVFALLLTRADWKRIAAYITIALVPQAIWMLRNLALDYPATGADRGPAYFTFAYGTETAIVTLLGWLPSILIALIAGMQGRARLSRAFLLVCAYFVVMHTVFIIWSQSATGMDSADNRLLAPIFVPLMYGLVAIGGKLRRATKRAGRRSAAFDLQ